MRVLIDTTYARRAPFSGTAVYLDRLGGALSDTGEVEVLKVANTRRRPPAGGGLGSVRNLLGDLWWAELELPRLARQLGAEVIHHPLPATSHGAGIPQVLTVHDLAFERLAECFDRRFRLYAHLAQRRAARRAEAVICVSETTAADVRSLWGISPERIVVALHGPGQSAAPAPSSPGQAPYYLYVGDAEPRKNLGTLLAAHALYQSRTADPAELVLAGSVQVDRPGVRLERSPNPDRLRALYAGALALIQPSLYEGFGLTALEAMSAGVPVLAARSPGLVEVCADAACYFHPHSEHELATAMAQIQEDQTFREALGQRGRRRAEEFTWAASARAHLTAYRLAIAGPGGRSPSRTPTLSGAK